MRSDVVRRPLAPPLIATHESMKILVLGAGRMGSFFVDLLSFHHEVAVFETDAQKLRFVYHALRFNDRNEIRDFAPELLINAVPLKHTLEAFRQVEDFLPKDCIISDIASVKTGFSEYYAQCGRRFVSTHPMFGPTFARLDNLSRENAIVITEGDHMGRLFFLDLYRRLGLNVFEYSFEEHDQTMAYSLSTPFVATFVFAAAMKQLQAPGTTFKRHLAIARGVLGEDNGLLREILWNPHTVQQVELIRDELAELSTIIAEKDGDKLEAYLTRLRENIGQGEGIR